MKRQLSFVVLAALGAFALVVLSGVPLPYATQAQAQSSPSVAVSLSSDTVEEGATIAVTMSFSGLESDADTDTKDYVFRADVVGADECEDQAGGYGLGVDRYIHQVDEDPETRTGTISADCPAGDYTLRASISSADNVELASASASFTVAAPAPEPTPEPTPESTPEPTPEPTPDQEDPDPSAALALSPAGFAPWNTEISVTMLFGALKADSDRDTTDYVFRADVVDADACEGDGLGIDRYMYQVDEDPETRSGTIAAGCPIGDYTIEASIATEADGVVASTSAEFSIFGPSIGLAIPVTEQGAGGVLTLIFGSLAPDADADTTDYIFRADVVDADACEGDGLGVDRHIHQVDEDPETHTGTISSDCPAGDYTLVASISSPDGVELASARASFSVAEPEEEEDEPPDSAQQQTAPALEAKVLVTGTVYEPQGGVIVAVRVRTDSYAEPQGSLTLTVQTSPNSALAWDDYFPLAATTVTFSPADFFGYYDSDSASGFYQAIKYVARLRIVDDNSPESDQQFFILMTKSSSAPSSATTQRATVTIKDSDEPRDATSNRQPRIVYASYFADQDAVTVRWLAGSDTQGLTGYKIERSAPGGATELTHADLRGNDRPAVASSVKTWTDTTVPASSLVLYRVWAVFSDGSEVASYAFPATMDRGIVRARITKEEGSNTRVDVSWTDAAYPLGDGSLHYGVCPEGYKVYQQVNIGGNIRWSEISAGDEDPAARTHLGTSTRALVLGTEVPFRIRCGGDSETTGLLIGEDTTTVQ